MTKHLHLHVGLPKCGSTSVQAFLAQNRTALLCQGIDYPDLDTAPAGNLTAFALAARPKHMRRGMQARSSDAFYAAAAPRLQTALIGSTADVVVLSSEALSNPDHRVDLQEVMEHFDTVTVHLILRPRAQLLFSVYGQGIRTNARSESFLEFLQDPYIKKAVRLAEVLRYWQGIVGKQAVQIHFMSPRFPDVTSQLMTAIGFEFDQNTIPVVRRNKSLSAFVLCAVAFAKTIGGRIPHLSHADIIRRAKDFDNDPDLSLLSPAIAQDIDASYADDTQQLLDLKTVLKRADIETDPNALDRKWATAQDIEASEPFQKFVNSLKS